MNHELEENKRKIRIEIGYGFMWIFIIVLLEGIPFSIGLGSLIYHPLAVLAGFGAVYKFGKGIKNYRYFKNNSMF